MLNISDLKKDTCIVIEDQPYKVLFSQLSKRGRAGSVLNTKLKNLISGNVVERNFKQADSFQEADISDSSAQFLYQEDTLYYFMDDKSFEQFSLTKEALDNTVNYLLEGTHVRVMYFNNEPVEIVLPPKVILEVIEAAPAVKGNTVDAANKTVVTETGLEVQVPMFIKQGDKIKISTTTNLYEEKING